jgi:phage FluMu protein Com
MTRIILVCPKCGKHLHEEDESRYYNDTYGCTITCTKCGLSLIGVDLSVCAHCPRVKREGHKYDIKFTTMVVYL